MAVLIVGSVALDDIKTPRAERCGLLGGSASYAAVAASFFSPVRMVGIVGEDFPTEHLDFLRARGVDLDGLQVAPGQTFRWSGEYMEDLNCRRTLSVALNVFENFQPSLPSHYRQTPVVLLGNIAPALQHLVLDQTEAPGFVAADTMDLWIQTARAELVELLRRVDLLILNDSEARELAGENHLVRAGRRLLGLGPRYVAVKKGEHGCLLFAHDGALFACPAYPLEDIHDPTGAGDTFAGALAGYLAALGRPPRFEDLREAILRGTVLASFNVEAFSLERLRALDRPQVEERLAAFRRIAALA